MYTGALAILNGYGMLDYISDLAARGYDVKIVGHSLGAGTAPCLSNVILCSAAVCLGMGWSGMILIIPYLTGHTTYHHPSPPAGTAVMAAAELKNHFMGIADQAQRRAQALLHPTISSPTPLSSMPLTESMVGAKVKEEGNNGGVLGDVNGEGKIKVDGKEEGEGAGRRRVGVHLPSPSTSTPSPTPTTSSTPSTSPSLLAAMMRGLVPSVRAVAYATPPCVCEVQYV
jgi:hypothetical protein